MERYDQISRLFLMIGNHQANGLLKGQAVVCSAFAMQMLEVAPKNVPQCSTVTG